MSYLGQNTTISSNEYESGAAVNFLQSNVVEITAERFVVYINEKFCLYLVPWEVLVLLQVAAKLNKHYKI